MSVQLNPSNQLGFNRPLTQVVRRTLTVTNHNSQPVAFKVKTTAPKLYCVRPNSGTIDPGESVDVQVLLQAMREDPPLSHKCKDKFLVQSMILSQDRLSKSPHDMWVFDEDEKAPQIHQQKIKVAYLPPEGQVLEEEDIGQASTMTEGELPFNTVRGAPSDIVRQPSRTPSPRRPSPPIPIPAPVPVQTRDEARSPPAPVPSIPVPAPAPARSPPSPTPSPPPHRDHRAPSPGQEYTIAEEVVTHHETIEPLKEEKPSQPNVVNINVVTPSNPPTPGPIPTDHHHVSNNKNDAAFAELNQRYAEAQIEINRLRGLLASIPPAAPGGGLRRRSNKFTSDDGSTVVGDDVSEEGTIIETDTMTVQQPEGVPLQLVVLIALGVFITTYLFF
ncbi:phosphatidylinositol-binding protein scs2 [Ceratobasidium sp. 428]|nr:phosphatidylinositol-binding protein scs2 [Ceratobasidium sp. 428]